MASATPLRSIATNKKIADIVHDLSNGKMELKPPFQRHLVWTTKHKKGLIDTILKGYPFPEIYLVDNDLDPETNVFKTAVVDGQQRVSAIYDYVQGNFQTGKNLPSYKKLPDEQKKAFMNYDVVVRKLENVSEIDLRQVFQRINATKYSLTSMEVRHAHYDHPLIALAKELIQHPYFEHRKIFKKNDKRRMKDLEWGLLVLTSMIDGYTDRDKAIDKFLEQYEESFEEADKYRDLFNQALEWIEDKNLSINFKANQKPHLFTLMVELSAYLQTEGKLPEVKPEVIKEFYENLPEDYLEASKQGSSNKKSREVRGYCLAGLFKNG